MCQLEQLCIEATELTGQLLIASMAEDWELMATLEQTRADALTKLFAPESAVQDPINLASIKGLIEHIRSIDLLIMDNLRAAKTATVADLEVIKNHLNALKAYSQNYSV